MEQVTVKQQSSLNIAGKVKDYMMLIKFSLSFMVVFSAVISYLLAPKVVEFDWLHIILLFTGGLLVTGSANTVNQIVEKDTDAMMMRTSKRPVASGRMQPAEAWAFAIIAIAAGLFILGYFFNWLSAGLALFSWFVYAYMYTPLKKVSAVSVLLGAVPGALPCLIGWAAGQDELSAGGWVLFAIQFFWQFPHFWAIAWISHKDYTNAGFKLMPSVEGPTKYSAIQSIIYSLVLIPVGMLPYLVGMSGMISFYIVLVANLMMLWLSIRLYREMEKKAARRVMFGSYIYLAVVLLALLMDKIPVG
ncbi:heme o synthase [Niastella populi]|uniref:Protoheme IX farnesyltransferase n=1 Tax=Niastella populi TaxID=550983 RepID=A0A1V9GBN1_9BACT|nr:heme o synthase [Niastella populi]OQP68075.1 protoheme IX farnesyltransferase [Niastella populi]